MFKNVVIEPSAMCELNGFLYFYQARYRWIMKLDTKEKKYSIVVDLINEDIDEVVKILSDGHKIFIIPRCGKYIYIYYNDYEQLKKIKLKNVNTEQQLFEDVLLCESKLYCIPTYGSKMLILDCVTETIVREVEIYEELRKQKLEYSKLTCLKLYNKKIFGNLYEKNKLFVYDVDNEKVIIHNLNPARPGIYTSFALIKQYIFLFDKVNRVIDKYSLDTFQLLKTLQLDKSQLYRISEIGEEIFVDNLYNEEIFMIDKEFNIVKKHGGKVQRQGFTEDGLCVGIFDQKKEYYFNASDNSLCTIQEPLTPLIYFVTEIQRECKNNKMIIKDIIRESKPYNLNCFLYEL